jgi:heat shock protein HtpX
MRKDFYSEIRANNWKTVLLFVVFFMLMLIVGLAFGLYIENIIFGLIIALIIGIIYSLIMYNSGAKTVLSSVNAKPVDKQTDPYLYNTVEGLSIAAGLKKMPQIYIMEDESMNAFATGISPEKSYICVTSGLRKNMNRQELEGVIAHEMSHIKNFDIKVMLLAVVLVGVVILLSDMIFRSML